MSAFLGPIHYKMYGKVSLQEELIAALGEAAVKEGWRTQEQLDADGIGQEMPPLEEVIDLDNIHGSLQGMIDKTEGRLADLAGNLLKEHPSGREILEQAAYKVGEKHAVDADANAEDAWHHLNSLLLDGMPCDRVVQVTEIGPKRTAWEQTADLHESYWSGDDRDVSDYYALRNALTRGMLSKTGCTFTGDDDHRYAIEK